MNIISTFDGISNLAYALVQMGHFGFNYYAFEIDKNAIAIARYNAKKYNYNYILMGGVENCTDDFIKSLGTIDVYCGGSPCTSLSIAGAASGKRSDGKSGVITGSSALFYEWLRIRDLILKYNPKCPWILENVKSATKECVDIISNLTGVQPVYLDGKMFSAQRRARWFWSNVSFTTPPQETWDTSILRDVLLDNVDAKYYLSEEQQKKIKWLKRAKTKEEAKTRCGPAPFPTPIDKKIPTILTTQGLCRTTSVIQVAEIGDNPHNSQANRIYDVEGKAVTQGACGGGLGAKGGLYCERIGSDKHPCVTTALGRQGSSKEFLGSCKAIGGIRRLCPIEVSRLFNLPDDYCKYGIDDKGTTKEMKDGPIYKALGNSFLWKKIQYILSNLKEFNK